MEIQQCNYTGGSRLKYGHSQCDCTKWRINLENRANDDSLMENITFINEDTIRYKYYYHGNGKWKANRCKILCYACHEHFLQPEEESYFIIFGYI